MNGETQEARIKRMRMRSWRRGIKEMDIILGKWADERLAIMDQADLDLYDQMLGENDQDLYQWVSGQTPCPDRYRGLISAIAENMARR